MIIKLRLRSNGPTATRDQGHAEIICRAGVSSVAIIVIISYDDQAQGSLSKFFDNSFKQSDSMQTDDSSPTPFCHMEERVEYEDKCETYKLETCHSLNREKCHTETLPKCRPVLKSKVEEVCLNVTDQVCSLVETEEQKSVEELYTVQSCSTGMEQVCGHSQDLLVTQKEQLQCVDLPTVNCTEKSVTLTDSNCTESVQFNCQQAKYGEEDTTTCVQTPTNKCIKTPRQVRIHRSIKCLYHYILPYQGYGDNMSGHHHPVLQPD